MKVDACKLDDAVHALKDLGARRVLLFGSYIDEPDRARDVDLAVEGIPLQRIVDADLIVNDILDVPTDLVSREENPAFFDVIADYARILYQQGT